MQTTTYYPNGNTYIVEKRVSGKRVDKVCVYDATGQKINTLNYYNDGRMDYIAYRRNGKQHNEHGSAYICWYINGQISEIAYRRNGDLHNLYGPAFIQWRSGQIVCIAYYCNDKLHNLHGPAYICWYINGLIRYITHDLHGLPYKLVY